MDPRETLRKLAALDHDTRARLWAETHKHDTTKQGEIVLTCEHQNQVGECTICGLASETSKMHQTFKAALADLRRLRESTQ